MKNNNHQNLFFIFLFYNALAEKLDGNTAAKKKAIFLN